MNILKVIWEWLKRSSTNPEHLSLTFKGLIPFLVLLGIDSAILQNISESFVNMLVLAGQLITAGITLWGFIRKIYLTLKS